MKKTTPPLYNKDVLFTVTFNEMNWTQKKFYV